MHVSYFLFIICVYILIIQYSRYGLFAQAGCSFGALCTCELIVIVVCVCILIIWHSRELWTFCTSRLFLWSIMCKWVDYLSVLGLVTKNKFSNDAGTHVSTSCLFYNFCSVQDTGWLQIFEMVPTHL